MLRILHHFGANKSFTIRTYRYPACNSFRIRTYKNTGGWGYLRLFRASVSPCLCGKSHVLSNLQPLVPLFALFPALPSFVFTNLEPLSAKHPGWGLSMRRRMRSLSGDSAIEGSQPLPNSFVSYHILVNPVLSCNYALFCATASQQVQRPQSLAHSFYRHGGGTPTLRLPSACAQTVSRPR